MEALLLGLLGLPVIGALVCYPLKGKRPDWVASLLTIAALVLGVAAVLWGFPGRSAITIEPAWLGWLSADPSTRFGFLVDPLSSLMLIVIVVLGALVVVYSTEYLSARNRDHAFEKPVGNYYFWLLLFIASMIGVALSPSFLQLFIFWELTTVCSWALISYTKGEDALRGGIKAMIMTHAGGLCFLIALGVIFAATRSFAFGALDALDPNTRMAVFLLLLVAAWTKAAQVPFFTWLPDAMVAPTPISAYLHAAAMVKAGVYLMARIAVSNGQLSQTAGMVMAVMATITILVAVILYFIQDDLKRLLAFSTIGHLGYIMFGVSLGILGSTTGFQGGVLHIINHGSSKGLLFLAVGAIAYATGSRSISQLSGLGRRMPLVSAAFIIGLLAVTGVPPLAGFWSKFLMFTGAFSLGGWAGPVFGAIILLESVASFAWYLFVGHKVFFGPMSATAAGATGDPPRAITLPLVILMAMSFLAPLIGWPLVSQICLGCFR